MERTKLQRIRLKKGLSQKGLSEASKISVKVIQSYEQRARPIDGARLKVLCELSKALDCRIDDILEDEELITKYRATR